MVLSEIDFAAANPDCLVGHRLGAYPGSDLFSVRFAPTNAPSPVAPFTFNEFTFRLPNGRVVHPNLAITGGGDLLDVNNGHSALTLTEHNVPGYPLSVSGDQFRLADPGQWVDVGDCAYMCAAGNYSGFLLGELPRLEMYEAAMDEGVPLVLHGDVKPFHRELLALAGVPESRVVTVPRSAGVRARSVLYATPTFQLNSVSYPALDFLRRRLAPKIAASNRFDRVYLSRSRLGPQSDRYIVNEIELEARLAGHGFQVLHPQDLSVADQLEVFASANLLISPFGAAWASSILRKPGATSALIVTKLQPEFARIFQCLGQELLLAPIGHEQVRDDPTPSRRYQFRMRPKDFAEIDAILRR